MAQYTGNLSTYQEINEQRNVRQVDDQIAYYDPNAAPLITMLNALKQRRELKSTHYEWYDQDYNARWAYATGTIANSTTANTLTVDDGTKFVPGDTFIVAPPAGTYAKTEICRVLSVSTNTLTIARDVGGGRIGTITSAQELRLTGSMFEEFAPYPIQKRSIPVRHEGYTQITRTPTSFSNTAIEVVFYGAKSSERDRAHIQDMIEHKCKLNSTLIWGRTSQSLQGGPNGFPIRSSPGLLDIISTNVTDAGGQLTWTKFIAFARQAFRYGPKDKVLVAAPIILEAIANWGNLKLQLKTGETKFGLKITTVVTPHGDWSIVRDWMLENGPLGTHGYGGIGISLDLDQLSYLYLRNRDTKTIIDEVKDGADGKRDEILTEYSFKIKLEKNHALLTNVTSYT
jgi:hypothetical protein